MTGKEIQVISNESAVEPWQPGTSGADWGADSTAQPTRPQAQRYLSALRRFKWLVLLCAIIGTGAGVGATRILLPQYEVQARVLLEQGSSAGRGEDRGGPIKALELFGEAGFRELLTSFMVVDPVVTQLSLYLQPKVARDSVIFPNFGITPTLRPGDYVLTVTDQTWVLSREPGVEVERGAVGDSIGVSVGFLWQPPAELLETHKETHFRVQTPREASKELLERLTIVDKASFLALTLTDPNPKRAADILNAWVDHFVAIAGALKKKNVTMTASILDGQRSYAAEELSSAEAALENFRVQTVTQPNERVNFAPGIELGTNPAFNKYFQSKNEAEAIQRDREAIQRALDEGRTAGTVSREAILSIASVSTDPAAQQVVQALKEQSEREVALRQLSSKYTDEYRDVKIAREQLDTLRNQVVPRSIATYLAQLSDRERRLKAEIDQSGKELQGIPPRTIEEQRLKRKMEVADAMYRSLDLEAARAKLAEAQTIPDVMVMDPAVAPLTPTRNTKPVLISGGIALGLGLGVILAILLDRLDKRFRYPEQAIDELGLFVLGVIPVIRKRKSGRSAELDSQVVEAFRTIRMNVRYSADPSRPLTLAITSPGPNDGKSLVSSNLALAFAEAGARVLLIDGDVRRGELSATFETDSRPGLVEYLDGTALIAEVLRPVSAHPNLTLMPGGARRKRAPELLASPRLSQLIAQMSGEYDVVIIDSPPLGAGFDAFALATAAGNVSIVLRAGVTDLKMASSKIAVLNTLPVRVIGCVLNGIKLDGVYEYYSYYQDYAAYDEEAVMLTEGDDRSATRSVTAGKS
jgi:polysaccharide biosynthesis transport protein